MASHANPQLSRLGDIAWSLWDPIGLRTMDSSAANSWASDEYDGYMLHVVGLIRQAASEEECVEYLLESEANHMGLGNRPDARERAIRVVAAISEYLASLGIPDRSR